MYVTFFVCLIAERKHINLTQEKEGTEILNTHLYTTQAKMLKNKFHVQTMNTSSCSE